VSSPETLTVPAAPPMVRSGARLTGIGSRLPDRIVTNGAIAARAGVDEDWIVRRTGIRARHQADAGFELVDLAAEAGVAALADAGTEAATVDLVLVATVSQERPMPNVAPQVAAKIGACGAAAFDLGAACSGFLYGLATAAAFIGAAQARQVLLIGADLLSLQTDPTDRRTAPLFGDGAAAVVLSATEDTVPWIVELGADGTAASLIETDRERGVIRMNGHETFIQAVSRMSAVSRSVCSQAGVDLDDIDLFVFHQANARITRAVSERLDVTPSRVVDCIAELGNTSAASIPLALQHARAEGRLAHGHKVLLCAVGAGLTWGAALIDWSVS
jgi:3-oxoacyl-[acyl-carrier-protein] synthase III